MELFRYPSLLAWSAAALAALVFFRFKAEESRLAAARLLLGPALERLTAGPAAARRRARGLLYLAALALAAAAAAGPQWGVELTPVTDLKGNIVIAVDTSLSMAARDIKPSRLENARLLLGAIAEKFADYRIGVVAFAGEGYVQCPLTTDQDAISYFASALTPGMLPGQGTDFSEAIGTTLAMLSRYSGQKVMVLITDGEDHSSILNTALDDAAAQNLKIFTIGIGTPDGELIPMNDSSGNTLEYKKDSNGKTVVSRLGETELMKIAKRTGAAYLRYSGPDSAAEEIRKAVGALELEKSKGKGGSNYKNRYQWPLALALLLLLIELSLMEKGFKLEFSWLRKAAAKLPRGAAAVAAGLFFTMTATLTAADGRALARKGNTAYDKKDWPRAFEYYSRALEANPKDKRLEFNTGDAFYRMEDYAKAGEFFGQAAGSPAVAAKAAYNGGNALYKAGDLPGAIAAYRKALSLAPKDENARFNLQKALEQKKKNSCKEPKDEKKDKDKKDKDKKDQDKKDQQKKEEKQPQDSKDQEKKDQEKKDQEKKKAEAKERSRQILEMMKEKEKAAARDPQSAQRALRQAGKPPPQPRMEDW
jgi:Ca-activated chloride channel family protein